MKSAPLLCLAGMSLLTPGLAADYGYCSPTNLPILSDCCNTLEPTDAHCPSDAPKACCTKEGVVIKVKDPSVRNLQCGSKPNDGDDVANGVDITIKPCSASSGYTGDCLVFSSNPGYPITDTHLQLSKDPLTTANTPNGLGNWNGNVYCKVKTSGICEVPLDKLKQLLGSTLCDGKSLYAAYHISITTPTDAPTCFAQGTIIGTIPARWFMQIKIDFECKTECIEHCCCKKPDEPGKYCAFGTAFGYNAKCNPKGEETEDCDYYLNKVGCQRWGWWHKIDQLPYTSDLYVGAAKENLDKGTKVGQATIALCEGNSKYCITYTMDAGYHVGSAHVEIRCDPFVHQQQGNYPCAPGGYNVKSTCPIENPSKWTGQHDVCSPATLVYAIFHGAITQLKPSTDTCTEPVCANFQDPPDPPS